MRNKIREEAAESVKILEESCGVKELIPRLKQVKGNITDWKEEVKHLYRKCRRIHRIIEELEAERDIIEERIANRTCAHCRRVYDDLKYKTPLMEGKVFCSYKCIKLALEETIWVCDRKHQKYDGDFCRHCYQTYSYQPYTTSLIQGKNFCSYECILSELEKTITQITGDMERAETYELGSKKIEKNDN